MLGYLITVGVEFFGDDIDYKQKVPSKILKAILKEKHEVIQVD